MNFWKACLKRHFPQMDIPQRRFFVQTCVTGSTILIEGEIVREAKDMTDPGNLMDVMRSDYGTMYRAYVLKRKQLIEQLQKIKYLRK